MEFLQGLLTGFAGIEWLGPLLARIAAGFMFAISGCEKLFIPARRKVMEETVRKAGLPVPKFNAWFVAVVELLAGMALMLGFLTALAAAVLTIVMVVAIVTSHREELTGSGPLDALSRFFYLAEVLYIVIFIWLIVAGPGPFSVDAWLAENL